MPGLKVLVDIFAKTRHIYPMNRLRQAIPLLVVLIVVGCSSVPDLVKQTKFERTSRAYEKAIRWSDFETASLFIKDTTAEKKTEDLQKLKHFKVIDYEIKKSSLLKQHSQVLQVAEISYYRDDSAVVKTFTNHQLWEYDETLKNWYLLSGLPNFK